MRETRCGPIAGQEKQPGPELRAIAAHGECVVSRRRMVQAAAQRKRLALRQYDCQIGEGSCTDMKAVRKDYFLDHDHGCPVDRTGIESELAH